MINRLYRVSIAIIVSMVLITAAIPNQEIIEDSYNEEVLEIEGFEIEMPDIKPAFIEEITFEKVAIKANDIGQTASSYESNIEYDDDEFELLARLCMAEVEGESELAKRMVIDTVLNRVDCEYFPDNIHDVIWQKNQFSPMWNGRFKRVQATDETRRLVQEELENRTNYDVIYFYAGKYSTYGDPMFQDGNCWFSSLGL